MALEALREFATTWFFLGTFLAGLSGTLAAWRPQRPSMDNLCNLFSTALGVFTLVICLRFFFLLNALNDGFSAFLHFGIALIPSTVVFLACLAISDRYHGGRIFGRGKVVLVHDKER